MARVPVAHVAFHGQLRVAGKDLQEAHVELGDRLMVETIYDYQEASAEREDLHVELRTWVNGEKDAESTFAQLDRQGVHDEASGRFGRRIPDLPEGKHIVSYEVVATVETAPWESTDARQLRQECFGEIHVTVA